jgi:hypothetical protein
MGLFLGLVVGVVGGAAVCSACGCSVGVDGREVAN